MPNFKDIFVDNTIAKNFCNPADPIYKEFIEWLFIEGSLAVSNKLLGEYARTCQDSASTSNIIAIINRQLVDGRLNKIDNSRLRAFRFKKHQENRLESNRADHAHIKVVMLSDRKLAITNDDRLARDINGFPGYKAVAVKRPDQVNYRK